MKPKHQRLPAAVLLLCLGLLVGAVQCAAITVVPPSFTGLVEKSDTVVRGTVTDRESRWVVNDAGYRVIKTFVTLRVEEAFKGTPAGGELVLSFLGGTVGRETMEVSGMPTFRKGQKGWFFIADNGRVLCPLVYAHHGAYLAVPDPASGQERVVRLNGAPLTAIEDIAHEGDWHEEAIDAGSDAAHTEDRASLSTALTATEFSAAIVREKLVLEARQTER